MKNVFGRLVSAFLALIMCVSLVLPVGAARVDNESAAAVKLTVGDGALSNTTDELQIPVTISFKNDEAAVGSFGLEVKFDENALVLTGIKTKIGRDYAIAYGGTVNVEEKLITWATDGAINNKSIASDGDFATDVLFWLTFKTNSSYLNGTYNIGCDTVDGKAMNFAYADAPVDFYVDAGTITLTGGLNRNDLKPTITTQPLSASYTYNADIAPLSVAATVPSICQGLTYQWFKNNVKIEGATEATYMPEKIFGENAYYCEVSTTYLNESFSAKSNAAKITYSKAALPRDRFQLEQNSFVYDGTEKSPGVSTAAAAGQTPLVAGVDWQIVRTCQSSATAAGTYTISVEGIGNYEGTIDWTWTIDRKAIEVPTAAKNLIYNGQTQIGVATGEGYSITGNTQKNAGNYSAVAVLDNNHKWTDGSTSSKNISWSIAPKSVEAQWSGTTLTYNGKDQAPTAAVNTGIAGETLNPTVSGAKKNVGEYTATASINNTNYTLTNTTSAYTIQAKKVDVVWGSTNLTYNGKEQAPAATVNTGIAGETLNPTVTGAKKDVGSYSATASINNANYALGNTTTDYTIAANTQFTDATAKQQNVVIEVGSFTEPKFTGVDGETVTGTTTYTYKGATKTAAEINADLQTLAVDSEAEIGYSFETNGNYVGTKTGTIKVKMVSIVYEVGGAAATNENAVTIKANPTFGDDWANIVRINTISASVNGVPVAGQYKLDVTGKPNAGKQVPFKVLFTATNDERYQNVEVIRGTVDVAPKQVAVTWGSTMLTYNGEEQAPVASAKGIDYTDIALTVTGKQTEAGQNYEAKAETSNTNYQLTGDTKTFSIAPKSVAVQWTDTELTYNGKAQAPTAVAQGIADYEIPLTMTTEKQTAVGTYTATVTTADTNYALTNTSRSFVIKVLALKAEDLEIAAIDEQIYAGTALMPAVTVNHKVTGEQLTGDDMTVNYTNNTVVGTGKITIIGKGNYTGTLTDAAEFVIAPKNVDVVWANTTLTYNGQEQTPTATVDTDIEGETLTPTVDGAKKDVGTYTATASIDNTNYKLGNTTTEFTIEANDEFTDATALEQGVVIEVGNFAEPKFTGVGDEVVTGTTTYTYKGETKTAAEINADLQTLALDEETEIGYSFVADGNYAGTKTGTIKVKMVRIIYKVGEAEATIDNAVTLKAEPVYGDDWADIVKINTITASVNDVSVPGKYTLNVTGKPNAGSQVPFKVLFTADDNGCYVDMEVVSGTVDVAAKKVPVTWVNTMLTYNGQEQAPRGTYKDLTNADIPVTVTGAQINVGEEYTATATTDDTNYELTGNTATFKIVPAQVQATVTVDASTETIANDTVLTANVTGNYDVLTYQWMKNGQIIEGATSQTYTVADATEGNVITVVVTSSGNYVGTASSVGIEIGKQSLSASVVIAGESTAVGSELTATVTGEGSYDIIWLADSVAVANASGNTYTVAKADQGKTITAKIVGKEGYTGEVVSNGIAIPVGRPDAVALTAAGSNGSVTLHWTAPANNGAAITGYLVKMDGEGQQWVNVAAENTSYTFTGLNNGTEYTFYIKAINVAGESAEATATATPTVSYSGSGGFSGGSNSPEEPTKPEVTVKTDNAGNKTETTVGQNGNVEVKAELKPEAVNDAVKNNSAIKLPMDPVTVGDKTTEVTVNTGAKDAVKVEIPVAQTTPGTVVAVVGADGEKKIIRDSVTTETGIVASVNDGDKLVLIDNTKTFADVTDSHWGKDAVIFVVARGIFNGTGDTTFAPNVITTRGMIAQVLHNLEYNKAQASDGHNFSDVQEHHWYDDAVHWAEDRGIVSGYGDGTFGGDKEVTRQELVMMLWNYAGKPASKDDSRVNGFNDADKVSAWAKAAVNWALENGVLNGKGNQILDPTGSATRAELAQMMKNYLENI